MKTDPRPLSSPQQKPSQTLTLRPGGLNDLRPILDSFADSVSILLVEDEAASRASGARPVVDAILEGRRCVRFHAFRPNPQLDDVEHGIAVAKDAEIELVIALGGGSAIDVAKLIALGSRQAERLPQVLRSDQAGWIDAAPLIAIPTTAGTGSEATHFAVLYIDGIKHSLAHRSLLPCYAIVDAELTRTLPAEITRATGLDAFCQAIESIWAVGATQESVAYAREAIELVHAALPQVLSEPQLALRQQLCRGSHLAGRAINITKTTLPHALSYHLTSKHGLAHGIAVAVTLPQVWRYNARVTSEDCLDPRGPGAVRQRMEIVQALLGAGTLEAVAERIEEFLTNVGCPRSLAAVGITSPHELATLAAAVNTERLRNNPRRITQSQVERLAKCRW